MASGTDYPTLGRRVVAMCLNFSAFYLAYVLIVGRWLPTGGGESGWFWAGIIFSVAAFLDAPWFRPPRGALAAAIGAAGTMVQVDLSVVAALRPELELLRWSAVGLAGVVVTCSVVAIFLFERAPDNPIGKVCYRLGDELGRGAVLLTPPALVSILGFYQQSLPTVLALLALWVFFVVVRPIDLLMRIDLQLRSLRDARSHSPAIGTIKRIDHPNVVRVGLMEPISWKNGVYTACLAGGRQVYVLPLFTQLQESQLVGTGLCCKEAEESISDANEGHVYRSASDNLKASLIEELSGSSQPVELLGFIVEGSTIAEVHFEVSLSAQLEEGMVVFANVHGQPVYYQILDARTAEETPDQNPRGKHVVTATQLGRHDSSKGFLKFPWLPAMNQPVFLLKGNLQDQGELSDAEFVAGEVPYTGIGLRANLAEIIEYHTAILGVTGTGKTELALDIVRQALDRDAKVFCVDFTGEYIARLHDRQPINIGLSIEQGSELERRLFDIETGEFGAPKEKKLLKLFLDKIRPQVHSQITDFLELPGPGLAVFQLAEITNTKATLRTTELFLSAIMSWARLHRKARQILIVLEEAHTIIPETSWSGFDSDTQWVVSRIGQIALQGRKYGVGLMVVSQRTALVSKTILSQCNTYFTHALIDQTSLNYLSNVFSSEHARIIPNLRFLHFLAYGKAIRSERPMLARRAWDEQKYEESLRLNVQVPDAQSVEEMLAKEEEEQDDVGPEVRVIGDDDA